MDYTNLKITDAEGNPHTAITFVVLNGVVSDIRLPAKHMNLTNSLAFWACCH